MYYELMCLARSTKSCTVGMKNKSIWYLNNSCFFGKSGGLNKEGDLTKGGAYFYFLYYNVHEGAYLQHFYNSLRDFAVCMTRDICRTYVSFGNNDFRHQTTDQYSSTRKHQNKRKWFVCFAAFQQKCTHTTDRVCINVTVQSTVVDHCMKNCATHFYCR